jgi:hypothetical protein
LHVWARNTYKKIRLKRIGYNKMRVLLVWYFSHMYKLNKAFRAYTLASNKTWWFCQMILKMSSHRAMNISEVYPKSVITSLKGYFVTLYTSVVLTKECNVMFNSEELIGTTEYLTI